MHKHKVFISCIDPPGPLIDLCKSIGRAIDLDMIVAERPEVDDAIDKVKRYIYDSDAILVIWEGDDDQRDWITMEYAIALAMNKPIAVIQAGVVPFSRAFKKDIEWISIVNETQIDQVIRITEYLNALKNILSSQDSENLVIGAPTFIRELVKHQVMLTKGGQLGYETQVRIKCEQDGLSLVKHSIHLNKSSMVIKSNEIEFELLPLDSKHTYQKQIYASAQDKVTFTVSIAPPLRLGEVVTYGWKTSLLQYLPEDGDWENSIKNSFYAFPEGMAQDHFFINHPTERLQIQVEIQDGSMIGDCEARAYNGRVFSAQSFDRIETNRISKLFTVKGFLERKLLSLDVPKPRVGFNYSILYSVIQSKKGVAKVIH